MIEFALNHRVAPTSSLSAFLDLAVALGLRGVEIRNELPGVAIADGTPPSVVRREAEQRGLTILSINALYPFNIWNDDRAAQARTLVGYAAACGSKAIVMCPLNDAVHRASDAERLGGLRTALAALAPMLREAGVTGLIEPLGFPQSSLRLKREAIEAVDDVGGADAFRLVHDTFHHAGAGETDMYPSRTGLVHISGVVDPTLTPDTMLDAHRVLVDVDDRIGNIGQIEALRAGGYAGPMSFEPFADSVSRSPDIRAALEKSMQVIRDADRTTAR